MVVSCMRRCRDSRGRKSAGYSPLHNAVLAGSNPGIGKQTKLPTAPSGKRKMRFIAWGSSQKNQLSWYAILQLEYQKGRVKAIKKKVAMGVLHILIIFLRVKSIKDFYLIATLLYLKLRSPAEK